MEVATSVGSVAGSVPLELLSEKFGYLFVALSQCCECLNVVSDQTTKFRVGKYFPSFLENRLEEFFLDKFIAELIAKSFGTIVFGEAE